MAAGIDRAHEHRDRPVGTRRSSRSFDRSSVRRMCAAASRRNACMQCPTELTMRLDLGCPARCSDAAAGELADVVIDPTRQRVTHLVIDLHDAHRLERLVPVELAYPDETSAALVLVCTIVELLHLPPVE